MSALTKLIDFLGLTAQTEELVDAMDAKDADNLQAAKSYADTVAAAAGSSAAASSIPLSQKGTPDGVAELNSQGIVPSHQLPSFVDDVIEGYRLGQHFYSDAAHTTIVTDETGQSADQFSGKIYVDLGDNQTYRWAGSDYAVISESLALGTTEATAGRGDWTYTAYQHALAKGSQFASNLYKITTNAEGHVIAATPVTKQDIVDLGIPGSDTVYEDATTTTHGLMSASDKAKLDGIETGAQANPSDATATAHGLMSAADKAKLDGIEANANNYTLPTMSPTTKGGAKLGDGLSIEDDALNLGPLTDSGSGASVQTDGCGIFGVTGEGWAEQDTTTGKNLLPPINTEIISGVTITRNFDGSLTLNGTASSQIVRQFSDSISVSANTSITLSNSSYDMSRYYIELHSLTSGNEWNYLDADSSARTKPVAVDSIIDAYLVLKKGSVFSNLTIYPQLEYGTSATAYEPYTGGKASPNPDYPQEIRVARGRNLVNENSLSSGYLKSDAAIGSSDVALGAADATQKEKTTEYIAVRSGESYTIQLSATVAASNFFWYAYRIYDSNKKCLTNRVSEDGPDYSVATPWYKSVQLTMPSGAAYIRISMRFYNDGKIQLEKGSTPTPYVPYGYIGLDITANGQTTTTPIPLPAKGFLGALPDGTKDTLTIDSAGGVVVGNVCNETVLNGSSHEDWHKTSSKNGAYIYASAYGVGAYAQIKMTHFPYYAVSEWQSHEYICTVDSNAIVVGFPSSFIDTSSSAAPWLTWLASNPVTMLYPLATPTTESLGYIDLPDLPEGATVSIPELEAIGVEWWVEGAEAMAEHGRDVSRANKDQEELSLFKSIILTGYSGSITETALYALHAELGTKSCLFNLSIDGVMYTGIQQGENANAYSIMLFNNEKYIYAGYSHINSWTINTISTI